MHNKRKQSKQIHQNKNKQNKNKQKTRIREKKRIIKNELSVLKNIQNLPSEIVDYIYLFLDVKIKYNLSFYYQLYKKYIINYTFNNRDSIYKDFNKFEYCTFDKTATPLKHMLLKIPINILTKYIYRGTPFKYFNIAFPDVENICDYMILNYRFMKPEEEKYKDYIFEIIDLISYFATRTDELSFYKINDSNEHCRFKEYESITKNIILSVIYIYNKYGIQSDTIK